MIDMFMFYPNAHMSSFIFKLFLEIHHILSVIQQHLGQQAQPTSRQRAGFTNKQTNKQREAYLQGRVR